MKTEYALFVLVLVALMAMMLSVPQSTMAQTSQQDPSDGWKCLYHFGQPNGWVYFYHLNGDGGLTQPEVSNQIGTYGPFRVWVADHRPLVPFYWADFTVEIYEEYEYLDCKVKSVTYVSLF